MNVALHCWAQRKGRPQETLAARGFLGRRGTENGPKLSNSSKSEVFRICQEMDEKMAQFRNRPLGGEYPYVWLDAKAVKTRENDRVVNMAAVVAVGVRTTGD